MTKVISPPGSRPGVSWCLLQPAPVPKMLETFLKISSTGCFPQGAQPWVCVPGDKDSGDMPVNSCQAHGRCLSYSATISPSYAAARCRPLPAPSLPGAATGFAGAIPCRGAAQPSCVRSLSPGTPTLRPPPHQHNWETGVAASQMCCCSSVQGGSGLWQSWCHLVHVTACCCCKVCAT